MRMMHGSSDPARQSTQVIYCVVSLALQSMLKLANQLLDGDQKAVKVAALKSKLAYDDGEVGAAKHNLPHVLVGQSALLYPQQYLFEIFLGIESTVLTPLITAGERSSFLSCLGNDYAIYVERELSAMGYAGAIVKVLENALAVKDEEDQVSSTVSFDDLDYWPRVLAQAFYRYYVGFTLNDFIRYTVWSLKNDLKFPSSVKFRNYLLTKKIMISLHDL